MAATTRNRSKVPKLRSVRSKMDFSQVGGLSSHIKLLREIIIVPLLYGDIYKHFNIKPPRGVIFHGPPGTGKTLVAGALAGEINKESDGKVSFYQRKGADILDKWVGESERKLRELFEKATKSKPSLIFFDELDGLAPERSTRNDQVHTSVVATLLTLMDGLDDSSGVVIIGATNRLDSVDSALRRPGRFDRELYFPLPDKVGRKEILIVHTKQWKQKPNEELLNQLADITTAFCGSDLQALCAEAVLCCLKRRYPMISQQKAKINLDLDSVKVNNEDFLDAVNNITPAAHRTGCSKARKLTTFIKPLLQRQIDMIMDHIEVLLPHFLLPQFKFIVGSDRYAGRLVLKGGALQGINTYLVPAILQRLEHMQSFVLDVPDNFQKIVSSALQNFPSILVISRADEWWDMLDNNSQISILTTLDDIHSGLPVLMIITCIGDLPKSLGEHFFYNSSINIEVDNPTDEEREQFFAPLFFDRNSTSVWRVWHNYTIKNIKIEGAAKDSKSNANKSSNKKTSIASKQGCVCKQYFGENCRNLKSHLHGGRKTSAHTLFKNQKIKSHKAQTMFKNAITDLVHTRKNLRDIKSGTQSNFLHEGDAGCSKGDSEGFIDSQIYSLWKRASLETSRDLQVVQLELLYDTFLASIIINSDDYPGVIKSLKSVLAAYENSKQKQLC